jgi:hypothetical protein
MVKINSCCSPFKKERQRKAWQDKGENNYGEDESRELQ